MNAGYKTLGLAGLYLFRDVKAVGKGAKDYGTNLLSNPKTTIINTYKAGKELNTMMRAGFLSFSTKTTKQKYEVVKDVVTGAAIYTSRNPVKVGAEVLNLGIQAIAFEGAARGYRAGKTFITQKAVPAYKEYTQVRSFNKLQKSIMDDKPYLNIIDTTKSPQPQKTLYGKDISRQEIKAARSVIDENTIFESKTVYTDSGIIKTGKIEYNTLKGNVLPDVLQSTKQKALKSDLVRAVDLAQPTRKPFKVTAKTSKQLVDENRFVFRRKPVNEQLFLSEQLEKTRPLYSVNKKQEDLFKFGAVELIPKKTSRIIRESEIIEDIIPKAQATESILDNNIIKPTKSRTVSILEKELPEIEKVSLKPIYRTNKATIQYSDEKILSSVKVKKTNIKDSYTSSMRSNMFTGIIDLGNSQSLFLVQPPAITGFTQTDFSSIFRTEQGRRVDVDNIIKQDKISNIDNKSKTDNMLKLFTGVAASKYVPSIFDFPTDGIITPPPTNIKKTGLSLFPSFGFGSGGGRLFKTRQKTRYTPSVEAVLFNIRGKQPKSITGLELRPLRG
jgi:hypothetical protein